MKAIFYFFLIAFAALIAAGVWFVAPALDAESLKQELNPERLFDRGEQVLTGIQGVIHFSLLDRVVEDRIGACKLMRAAGGSLVEQEGLRFPFSSMVALNGNSVLCAFGSQGKSILFTPVGPKTTVKIRRFPRKPGLLTMEQGGLMVVSDELSLLIDLPAFVISLRSEQPVKLMILQNQTRSQISVLKGTVEAQIEPKSGPVGPIAPVFIAVFPGTTLTTGGKTVTDKAAYVKAIPTGFEIDPTQDPPAAPTPGQAPPVRTPPPPVPVPPPAPGKPAPAPAPAPAAPANAPTASSKPAPTPAPAVPAKAPAAPTPPAKAPTPPTPPAKAPAH